ncbi:MAG: hypothetical protein QOE37_463 [Microbacteriaceae bacterium]|nr:hypothetical protein [Microbacteriaceae bacterium]MDT7746128.1 hypothetical protein [Actinomycetota bacterium]
MYDVRPVGNDVAEAIEALPADFLAAFAELRVALEVSPSSVGRPYVAANPGGSRTVGFGPGGRGLMLFAVEDTTRKVVWLWQVTLAPDLNS